MYTTLRYGAEESQQEAHEPARAARRYGNVFAWRRLRLTPHLDRSLARRGLPGVVRALHEASLLALVGGLATLLAFAISATSTAMVVSRLALSHGSENELSFGGFFVWAISSIVPCVGAAMCVHFGSEYAAGSGIPLMKAVLSGSVMDEYLSLRTLGFKALGLALALGGGLPVGKEGPFVHMASCIAASLCNTRAFSGLFADADGATLRRQLLAAGCAAGVSATFGSPVGGVLFAMEVTRTYYSVAHLWKGTFAAVCGALAFRAMHELGGEAGGAESSLVQVTSFEPLPAFLLNGELLAFAALGVAGGAAGALFVQCTGRFVRWRRETAALLALRAPQPWPDAAKRPLAGAAPHAARELRPAPAEAGGEGGAGPGSQCAALRRGARRWSERALALALSRYGLVVSTALLSAASTFPLAFFRQQPHVLMNELFDSQALRDDVAGGAWGRLSLLGSLLALVLHKFGFAVLTQACAIPAGVFTPAFAIGAAGGRLVGELLNVLLPESAAGVTAGAYAVVGAAAMASGVTQTVSPAVIVFETTGQSAYLLPILVAVLCASACSAALSPSVYELMAELSGLHALRQIPAASAAAVGGALDGAEGGAGPGLVRALDVLDGGRAGAPPLSAEHARALEQRCSLLQLAAALRAYPGQKEFAVVASARQPFLLGAAHRCRLEALLQTELPLLRARLHGAGAQAGDEAGPPPPPEWWAAPLGLLGRGRGGGGSERKGGGSCGAGGRSSPAALAGAAGAAGARKGERECGGSPRGESPPRAVSAASALSPPPGRGTGAGPGPGSAGGGHELGPTCRSGRASPAAPPPPQPEPAPPTYDPPRPPPPSPPPAGSPGPGLQPPSEPGPADCVEACVGGSLLPLASLPHPPDELAALGASWVLLVAPDDGRLRAQTHASAAGGASADGGVGGARPVPVLSPAPAQLVAAASLAQVHVLFVLLGLSHAYVTDCGELIGEITREELVRKLNLAE